MDGCTSFRTFFQIIIPIAIPMLITVFIFAFSWQWTDDFYINTFWQEAYWNGEGSIPILSSGNFATAFPNSLTTLYGGSDKVVGWDAYVNAVNGTSTILIALPLIIAFIFLQGKIVQGIERSGIVG